MSNTAEDAQAPDPLYFPGAVAEREPDRPALIMASSGEIVTYAELDDMANRLSQLFRAAGLERGDHVAFCLENGPSSFRLPGVATMRACSTPPSVHD